MSTLLQFLVLCAILALVTSHINYQSEDRDVREEELVEELDEVLRELEKADFYKVWSKTTADDAGKIEDVHEFLRKYDEEASKRSNFVENLDWNYETNVTDENAKKFSEASVSLTEWSQKQSKIAENFLKGNLALDYDTHRQLKKIATDSSPKNKDNVKKLEDVSNKLSQIYATAKACNATKCYSGEPDLEDVFASSRDYYTLLWSWKTWRDVTGPKMKDLYTEFIDLLNIGARDHGFPDTSEVWSQSCYEQSNKELETMVDKLWEEVQPMYEQLHAYVRRKLREKYPMADIQDGGLIPAHLLGNMWAQQWDHIYDIVVPYPELPSMDVTNEMVKQGYTPLKMFHTAESFFTSIGLPRMTREFWERSMIEKPKDRTVQCHGSASEFSNGKDFRIKMCTRVTMGDLKTIHHEMGHIEYYMAYKDLPLVYRGAANSAVHEAIGDTIALSVMTPEHFAKIKLLKKEGQLDAEQKKKMDINFLMSQALFKLAFLPFGLLIDKWRWGVFKGEIDSTTYNRKWWELRMKYQGIKPPIPRSENDFDPGAKYHIPSNTPYIRYFQSFLVQFQYHSALCEAAGYSGPLHHCDIYNSKEAGKRLEAMLKMGKSKPWPDALEVLTGQRKIDTSKIKSYFQPLLDWLKKENGDDVGWTIPQSTD